MSRTEIRITGFGGQGVVLAGYIIGRACAIDAGRHATLIQSFGPEARGSACSATLAVCDTEVLYPYIQRPDIFVVMSGEGYERYRAELKDDGVLIYEKDLVHPTPGAPDKAPLRLREGPAGPRAYGIPSTRIAESLGRAMVQNIVMVGFFTAVTQLVSRAQMRAAVQASVPPGTEELNLKAFDAGCAFFDTTYGEAAQSPALPASG